MPAGPARAPGRIPLGFTRLGVLPEHEVERIALTLRDVHTGACLQFVKRAARELAVPRELTHGKVDVAVNGLIGMPLFLELFHEA